MAQGMKKFSPATRGTPVVAREDGEERDVVSESAAQNHDPAPAELDKYRKLLIAYEAGKQARADGVTAAEAVCWQAGYYGEPMPEFGEDW